MDTDDFGNTGIDYNKRIKKYNEKTGEFEQLSKCLINDNSDMFDYMSRDFNIDELEGVQSSNADVIGNMETLYQLATGINEPAPELVEGLKIITEFIQNEQANEVDSKVLIERLNELKHSYYKGVKQ